TYPFAPPVGLMYVLWDAESAFDAWLATPPAVPVRLDEAYLRRVVAECREHGYLVESLTSAGRRLYTLMAGVAAGDLPPAVGGRGSSSLGLTVREGSLRESDSRKEPSRTAGVKRAGPTCSRSVSTPAGPSSSPAFRTAARTPCC